uniref:SAM domain-containing protein SAMSN-1-like n=2 Tax=Takifugu rubripes TaxID=31033 RepID=A0A3B5K045_TAKRU
MLLQRQAGPADMNLFCFSLGGSTDSLYEAVQSCSAAPPVPSRSCSVALLLDDSTELQDPGRLLPTQAPQKQVNKSNKKKRTHITKSASDNEALGTRKIKTRTEPKERTGTHQTRKRRKEKFTSHQGGNAEKSPGTENETSKTGDILGNLYCEPRTLSCVTIESNVSCRQATQSPGECDSYQGRFCGRARVHTDFDPSPYDTDSLKLKIGDIIDIISKPAMGIWTGVLNNKVGNFKFIYVDVLEEEEAPEVRQQKLCKGAPPQSLLELLQSLNLEDYASALLPEGCQTVQDLLNPQKKQLIELNIKDPEHRYRLLAAAEYFNTEGDNRDSKEHTASHNLQEEDSDCPRDSGCFISSECLDSKEETEQLTDSVYS